MRKKFTTQAVVSIAVLTLALSACKKDNNPQGAPMAPSSDVSAPSGAPEAGGTDAPAGGATDTPAVGGFEDALGATEAATATYTDSDGESTELEIKPEKVVKGSWSDFKGFDLKDTETDGMVPYYITMSYTSKGGAEPWITGWDGKRSTLIAPDQEAGRLTLLDDSFKQCLAADLSNSGPFKKGTTEKPCKVYMVPEGKPVFVRWGVGGVGKDVKPIVWKVQD
ncbi:hypothetical protein J7I98_33990 [Streptomyces sp. ISL-98]|uniref:hypothetical protein n=1 Tax=Streptomyces sp. ISL-98 TaxID=2819192 RepID=UPI001BECD328|nr:hypothetical protein [Streptomyces sp. ISL-98]MBT2510751.1 hypothetical protein [Streptomyces sp. ISL-98]